MAGDETTLSENDNFVMRLGGGRYPFISFLELDKETAGNSLKEYQLFDLSAREVKGVVMIDYTG
ncbi:hypothetical protein [Streptococcus ovuberis]|uniref:Uncharacterized protein n=1 Tax=Streptococcus ovuberis TaxID=1936207 RepID=A0A7X6MXU3_9STRE|nr:hypothetical protein [Streptococcus ovuberis]NKZ19361.1 hypothetical protein [Streptococcus ovuberis]